MKIDPELRIGLDLGKNAFVRSSQLNPRLVSRLAYESLDALTLELSRAGASKLSNAELVDTFVRTVSIVHALEAPHRFDLEELAVTIVRQELMCHDNTLELYPKLVEPPKEVRQPSGLSFDTPEIPNAVSLTPQEELEVSKRRVINAVIQGGALKIQNAFHLYDKELDALDPRLLPLYRVLVPVAHTNYWTLPDIAEDTRRSSPAGVVSLGFDALPIAPGAVHARALTFPLLIHELAKGMLEVLALHGLPPDRGSQQRVLAAADKLHLEAWDLRVGPSLFSKVMNMASAVNANRWTLLQSWFMQPAADFLSQTEELCLLNRTLAWDAVIEGAKTHDV